MKYRLVMITGILLLGAVLLLSGCSEETVVAQAKDGDVVKVHYTGTLDDGTQFDTSKGREPLEFTMGMHMMIPGFEAAVMGMAVGEKKTVTIPPEEAYGPYNEEALISVEKSELPPGLDPQVGQTLQMRGPDGSAGIVTVTEITETTIELDANHPLAGKALTFEIEVVEIK